MRASILLAIALRLQGRPWPVSVRHGACGPSWQQPMHHQQMLCAIMCSIHRHLIGLHTCEGSEGPMGSRTADIPRTALLAANTHLIRQVMACILLNKGLITASKFACRQLTNATEKQTQACVGPGSGWFMWYPLNLLVHTVRAQAWGLKVCPPWNAGACNCACACACGHL